jgi:saccharopine dehydrogenase-like NADP-dependent oxidoreductase
MHRVLLLGAGKIGSAIAKLLSHAGDYDVVVAIADTGALSRLDRLPSVMTMTIDVGDRAALRAAMEGRETVVSACSFASTSASPRRRWTGGSATSI